MGSAELAEKCDLCGSLVRQVQVVVAEPGKEITSHVDDRGIHCACDAAVGLMEIAHPIAIRQSYSFGLSPIGGTVVDDNDLQIIVFLRQRTL